MARGAEARVGGARFFVASARSVAGGAGAIGVVQVVCESAGVCDRALGAIGLSGLRVGGLRVADLLGVDRGVAARWDARTVQLMAHGGVLVMDRLCAALAARGIEAGEASARERYPEAEDAIEACAMDAIARAASPLAVDVILRQVGAWRALRGRGEGRRASDDEQRALDRLIEPALVVAAGPANVGKSTLVNALAGRRVSIVADEPGTTRDHVGVQLDLGGLVVRWADAPGRREGAGVIEREAGEIAAMLVRRADLVVSCGDVEHGFAEVGAGVPVIRCATRCDLGVPEGSDVRTSAIEGRGLEELVLAVRETLAPAHVLASGACWRFHEELGDVAGGAD